VKIRRRLRHSLALSLTARIYGFVSLIIVGVVGYLLLHEHRLLDRELQDRGLLAAGHLAQQSVDPILREDDYALFKLVQLLRGGRGAARPEEDRIAYAMVLDMHGRILAHTEPGRVHTALTDARTLAIFSHPEPSVAPVEGAGGERLYSHARGSGSVGADPEGPRGSFFAHAGGYWKHLAVLPEDGAADPAPPGQRAGRPGGRSDPPRCG
jgi:hypothetical protein